MKLEDAMVVYAYMTARPDVAHWNDPIYQEAASTVARKANEIMKRCLECDGTESLLPNYLCQRCTVRALKGDEMHSHVGKAVQARLLTRKSEIISELRCDGALSIRSANDDH